MTNPLSEAREAMRDALQLALPEVTIYASPPSAASAPGVILAGAASGWLVPLTFTRTQVALTATVIAAQGTNEAAQQRLEETVWAICSALRSAGAAVGSVSGPVVTTYGAQEFATAEIEVVTNVVDDETP